MMDLNIQLTVPFRSLIIEYAKAGTTLTIFDSPSGSKDDDYTVIKIRQDMEFAVSILSLEL
jgi:hypothetical protein